MRKVGSGKEGGEGREGCKQGMIKERKEGGNYAEDEYD